MSDTNNMTKNLALIGVMTAFMAIMAQIAIPMPLGVPLTMQTFAVTLTGIVLGSKRSTITMLIYLLIGAVGIPVFANFNCGVGALVGPTGGFILSFPLMALVTGLGMERGSRASFVAGITLGNILNFLIGMLMFMVVTGSSLKASFVGSVLPFIPGAFIKSILAGILGIKVKQRIGFLQS